MQLKSASITTVAGYVPEDVLTNEELEKLVETSDEWIQTRTGIKERRVLKGEGQGTSVMATEVLRQLCEKRGISPLEIDGVIIATVTPDYFFPSTANLVCHNLGATNAFSFDMAAACSGFVYALETGANFIRTGGAQKIAVIGADKMTSIVDYTDRNTCILFGDAAAGVLLEPGEEGYGLIDSILRSDGVGKDLIYLLGGGSVNPPTQQTIEKGMHYFYQDGKSVFKYAVTNMADVAAEIMDRNNLKGEDVAWLVPHQANKRIIDATANRMGVSTDKVTLNIERYGNTTAATIPLCLWEWENKFKRGDNIILAAFGGGFTWGSAYIKWGYNTPS
jgi:3-oxoacyl-[acyl-carrier-protein] synthase III